MVWLYSLILFCFLSFHSSSLPKPLVGKFVAFDKLQSLTSPAAPRQMFVVEVQREDLFSKGQLLRVVYFPETTSLRGGAKFLSEETLNYTNTWNLRVHKPSGENERAACKDVDNFFRAADNSVDEDDDGQPILRFRSTYIKADLKFDNLPQMPCLILDSLTK